MLILLTGATGFLGRELLIRLLARGHEVVAVARLREGEDSGQLVARLRKIVEATEPGTPTAGLRVVPGDVTRANLGLDEATRAELLRPGPAIQVVHAAADVRFDAEYEAMYAQNVEGVKNALALAEALAERGKLRRFDHVSTAFVAGDRRGLVLETEVDVGQGSRNAYERTKLEAELEIVSARTRGLPTVIHRPSIIVGDSRSGRASSFKVLYWPLKVYARGRFRTLFGRAECTIDAVPVDFVADAICLLLDRREAEGRVFHLAAGPQRHSTIGELAGLAEKHFQRPPVRFVDPRVYRRYLRPILRPMLQLFRPEVARGGAVYLPYLEANPSFSIAEASSILGPAGLEPPKVTGYFDVIVDYAKRTDFGRRPIE